MNIKKTISIIAIALATAFSSTNAQSALGHWTDIAGNQLTIESGKESVQVITQRGEHIDRRTAGVEGNTIVYYKKETLTLTNSPDPTHPVTKEAQIKVVFSLSDENTLHETDFLCFGNTGKWVSSRNQDWKRTSK